MRTPAVAGYFYPLEKKKLDIMLDEHIKKAQTKIARCIAIGGICPHAGYIYSGDTAAVTYSSIANLKDVETVIILGPNHTGEGSQISISLEDWETPLGIAKCNKELAKKIKENSKIIEFDESAHVREHSIEVQIPFIQKINPNAKIVCICMLGQDYASATEVGSALVKSIDEKKHLVIASSDFSHYLPSDVAEKNDKKALEFICNLNAFEFENAVENYGWSICGYGPISALLEYAKEVKTKVKILEYTNSGKTSGDFLAVVGYASVVFPIQKL